MVAQPGQVEYETVEEDVLKVEPGRHLEEVCTPFVDFNASICHAALA